ncbi:MAG: O-antigen ligase family protein [Nostoc sp.]
MVSNHHKNRFSYLALWVGVLGVGIGIVVGLLAGVQPLLLAVALVAVATVVSFSTSFEQTVLGLLILRSSLDPFSAQQIPAAFALGLDALTILYVVVLLLTGRTVQTDKFWWFFAGWVALQSMWIILMPLGALALDGSYLPYGLREWVRLFSWVMVYLLVMQLKGRIPPKTIISMLFLALILPTTIGLMQMFVPSLVPSFLSGGGGEMGHLPSEGESRVRGTLGLANTFGTFLLLFIGLTWWKLNQSQQRWPWLLLLGLLAFLFVGTKSLFTLVMLAVFILVLIAPKLSIINLLGGLLLFAIVIGLFTSSDFGQERLGSISQTPLLNPDIDRWRAILLSQGDNNSFNWRIAQWTFLLQAWENYPIFGTGIATCSFLTVLHNMAHNDYVRALTEQGVVGLCLFLIFLGTQVIRLVQLLRSTRRGSAQNDLILVMLAILLAVSVGMITENIWSHTTLFFYWWTLFAIAGWNWSELKDPEKSASVNNSLLDFS